MTLWEQHCKDNSNSDDFIGLEVYVGKAVKHIVYSYADLKEASESWSESVHIIEAFDDNVCGDGCCNGFVISSSNLIWRSDQLKLVELK